MSEYTRNVQENARQIQFLARNPSTRWRFRVHFRRRKLFAHEHLERPILEIVTHLYIWNWKIYSLTLCWLSRSSSDCFMECLFRVCVLKLNKHASFELSIVVTQYNCLLWYWYFDISTRLIQFYYFLLEWIGFLKPNSVIKTLQIILED